MRDPDHPLEMTEGQRRHVRLVLEGLVRAGEERLARWAETGLPGPEGEAAREELEEVVRSAREAAKEILDEPITVTAPDPARSLATWASAWWSTVLDCRPGALKAYGDVDAAAAEALTPVVEELAERLLRLKARAEDPASGS